MKNLPINRTSTSNKLNSKKLQTIGWDGSAGKSLK